VLLHGYGANANDLLPMRDALAPGSTAIAFEAPIDLGHLGMPGGHAWFHLGTGADGSITYEADGVQEAVAQLAAELPAAVEAAGHTVESTTVLGFSQGAMLGHCMLLRSQLPIQALAACSGRMIPELFGDGTAVPANMPVFLSHGTDDELIPVTSGQAIRAFYESNTQATVTWCEEPIGHGIGPKMMQAMHRWFGEK
jgi:phospholipase/carboxylesterase